MSDSYQAALSFLYGRIDYERALAMPYGRELKLDRMRDLLARLDNPQDLLPIVHVAGTKGKGSTSAMISAVLSAAGYSTGLYTSPHLERLEERFMVDGRACDPAELVKLTDLLRPTVAEMDREAERSASDETGPTYFELTTAIGFLHFVRRRVNAAVVEVGLGGRLDSTNVCLPRLAIITSISFDHMKQLGNTLEAIAQEKAGIVKPGVPVISGVTADGPRQEIEKICVARSAPLVQLGRDFDFAYHPATAHDDGKQPSIDFVSRTMGHENHRRGVTVGLLGAHQGANAAIALAAVDQLNSQGWSIPETAVRQGLAEVRWPARIEVVARRPTIILDAAHNVASIAALVQTLRESFSTARERILVFATTRDKQVSKMLELLLPHFDRTILTRYENNPRGVPPDELAACARQLTDASVEVCPHPAVAWQAARESATEGDLICVTGSFFIASEMRTQWSSAPFPAVVGQAF